MADDERTPGRAYDGTAQGTTLTGTIPVRFELAAVAIGKRRNEVQVGMVRPRLLRKWDLASDEAAFHGGEETAPKPLAIFATGILTCFMTQMRTFARDCGVEVQGLRTTAAVDWTAQRNGLAPYVALPGRMQIDIELDTQAPIEAQKLLVKTAARGCFAEAMLREPPLHRLWHGSDWITCNVSSNP